MKRCSSLCRNPYGKTAIKCLYFILTVIILSLIALYNKFPLLYPDSGTYLSSSISLFPAVDKVIGYSLFIRIVTWQATSWTIVLFQNLIISYLIFMFLKLFFNNKQLYFFHFFSIITLMLFSSLCWFSCQIMPDIFTSALILVVLIFLNSEKINKIDYFIYLLLLFFFLISHLSNVILLIFLLLSIIAFCLFKRNSGNIYSRIKKRSYVLFLVGIVSVLFIMTYNYAHKRGFRTSASSNVLLVAKFDNIGLLKTYLDDNCKTNKKCVLCKYKDSLPKSSDEFLWSNRSPLYDYKDPLNINDSWTKADSEYSPIVKDILLTPKYYSKLIKDAVKYTFFQLISFKIGTGKIAFRENSPPYYPYRDNFTNELNSFLNSLQNTGKLYFGVFEIIINISVGISIILILFGLFYIKQNFVLSFSTAIITLSLIFNAFITSTLSVVEDRYQSRIIWLISLLGIVYMIKLLLKKSAKS